MNKQNKSTGLSGLIRFIKYELWQLHTEELGRIHRLTIRALRFLSLVCSRLKSNRCNLHAASLTFFSLMALIPVLAMTLALARAFGGGELAKEKIYAVVETWTAELESGNTLPSDENALQNAIAPPQSKTNQLPPQTVSASAISSKMRKMADELLSQLDNINFGTLGGIGAVMLLWTVIGTLDKVETSFNEVWNVRSGRPLARKAADYLFAIIILPFLCLAASTIPVVSALSGVISKIAGEKGSVILDFFSNNPIVKIATVILFGWIFFSFLIGFMPNTKVRAKAAIIGGLVTAVLATIWLKLCTMLQIGIAQFSTLYGGFATLPILLAWLFMSWKIVLVGAEIAFAAQYCNLFFYSSIAEMLSVRSRLTLSLMLVSAAAKSATDAAPHPLSVSRFATDNAIPRSICSRIINELVNVGILLKVDDDSDGNYVLCGDASSLRVRDVLNSILNFGADLKRAGVSDLPDSFSNQLQLFDREIASLDTPVLEI